MPTIIGNGLFSIKIFGPPREHPPPHVHVFKAHESAVVIKLGIASAAPSVWLCTT